MIRIAGVTFALLAALVGTNAQSADASTPQFHNCPKMAVNNVKSGVTNQQCGDWTVVVTPDDDQTRCGFGTPVDYGVQLISEGPGGCTLEAAATATVTPGAEYYIEWEQQGFGEEELSQSFIGVDGGRANGTGVNNTDTILAIPYSPPKSTLDLILHLRQSTDCITVPGGRQCPPAQFVLNVVQRNGSTTSSGPSSTTASTSTRSSSSTSLSATQSPTTTSSGQSPVVSGDIAPDFSGCPSTNGASEQVRRVTCGGNGGTYTVTVTPDAGTACEFGVLNNDPNVAKAGLIVRSQGPGGCTLEASTTFPVDVNVRDYALDFEVLAATQADLQASYVSLDGIKVTRAQNGVGLITSFTPTKNSVDLVLHLRDSPDCAVGGNTSCVGNEAVFAFGRYATPMSTSSPSISSASATASASSTSASVTASRTSSASGSATSVSATSVSATSVSATSVSATSVSSTSVSPSATSRSTASTTPTGTPTATPSSRSQKKRLQEENQLRLNAEQGQHCPVDTEKCPVAGWADSWECIDTSNELSSCGGCASTGAGVDCEAIAGIAKHGSQCVAGRCVVKACAPGFKVAGAGSLCVAEKMGQLSLGPRPDFRPTPQRGEMSQDTIPESYLRTHT